MDLISLFCLCHSWMWPKICVALFCWKVDNKSVPASYQTGSWKWLRNTVAKSTKSWYAPEGSSMYHFVATWVTILWKSLNRMASSFSEFEEHQRWKVVMCALGYSPSLTLNLGMSEGYLIGTSDHTALCHTGLFINFYKYGKFKVSKKGIFGLIRV